MHNIFNEGLSMFSVPVKFNKINNTYIPLKYKSLFLIHNVHFKADN